MSAKEEIIDLMKNYASTKNDKDKQSLIEALQNYSVDNNLKEEYEKFAIELKQKSNNVKQEYRYCGPTRSSYYHYFINEDGLMRLMESENSIEYNDDYLGKSKEKLEKENEFGELTNFDDLKLENGYISTTKEKTPPVKLATSTDIYKFMEAAGWLNFDNSYNIAENIKKTSDFKNDRLEIHHINNNPNDNRVENLIYLSRSIHCHAHKYIDNGIGVYTFELTDEQYKAVKELIDNWGK